MKVTVDYGNGKLTEVEINKFPAIVGRGKQCDIVLESDHVSRKHLEIIKVKGDVFIKDLTLANWVSYSDEKLEKGVETQYFDFALLILPGGISVRIADEIVAPIVQDMRKNSKSGRETVDLYKNKLPVEKKKSTNESKQGMSEESMKLAVIVLAFIGALGYVYYEFYLNGPEYVPMTAAPTPIKKAKVIPKKKQVKPVNTAPVKKQVTQKINSNLLQEFNLLIAKKDKCTGFTTNLCRLILKNKYPSEGLIAQEGKLIVLKNHKARLENLFSANLSMMEQASVVKDISLVVGGEFLLMPRILESLEKRFITSIEIYIFENTLRGLKLKTKLRLDTSFYRRYDLKDYNLAYQNIKKNLDMKKFNKEFAKFFIRE